MPKGGPGGVPMGNQTVQTEFAVMLAVDIDRAQQQFGLGRPRQP